MYAAILSVEFKVMILFNLSLLIKIYAKLSIEMKKIIGFSY